MADERGVLEAETDRSDFINRLTKHKFFSQALGNESCPPNRPERHPQVELPSAIATNTSNAVGTGPINHRAERKRVQLVSQVGKLARVSLMRVIEQQRSGRRTGHE